jgi:hypothetical protein
MFNGENDGGVFATLYIKNGKNKFTIMLDWTY